MSSYGYSYIPSRLNYSRCGNKRCPPKIIIIDDNGQPLTGNINLPTFELTQNIQYSTFIKTAIPSKRTKTVFSEDQINPFGQWQGGPNGSGKKLSNNF